MYEGLKEEKGECEKASPVALNSHWFELILTANVIWDHVTSPAKQLLRNCIACCIGDVRFTNTRETSEIRFYHLWKESNSINI